MVGLLWLIIGITIGYFVMHEKNRQKFNLENRLLNVNNTVIDAYERGVDLQNTVNFIRLFTDNTTLAPLRITVYDNTGRMVADNPEATIKLYDKDGRPNVDLLRLLDHEGSGRVRDILYDDDINMICSRMSDDGRIYSLAALPYEDEVVDYLKIDPTIWIVVIILGLLTSMMGYFGVRAICRNVYVLRDFAKAIASDTIPDDIDTSKFSNDELGEVSRNLLTIYSDKIRAEQEKMHHERRICMNVSHELNTPVGIIKGYIDTVLNDRTMPPEIRDRFLERAQQTTDRLVNLVGDINQVMRLGENGTNLQCAPVDLFRLVARLAEDIAHDPRINSMEFVYDIPDPCMVIAHESLLTNALLNLINNAARHSGGSRIELRYMGRRGNHIVFSFADNGIGVEEKHLTRLFDLFYRVDSGRSRKSGGSGLGLPLVRRIFNAIGGGISVANAPQGGLIFTFTLVASR